MIFTGFLLFLGGGLAFLSQRYLPVKEILYPEVSSRKQIINVNKADISELEKIPGIGRSIAQRIVLYREEKGEFKDIEELKEIKGIGEKKLKRIKEYIGIFSD